MVDGELAVHAGGVLAHGEIDTGTELLPVDPHVHLPAEGVDVQRERLEGDLVGPGLAEFLLKVFPSLVGAVFRVPAALVFAGAELLDDPLEERQVLRLCMHGSRRQQEGQCVFDCVFHV